MNEQDIIKKARKSFDEDFAKLGYMEARTSDYGHLKRILESLTISPNNKVLDLGTGSGYLAFPIAEVNVDCNVVGLDITVNTLATNRAKAAVRGLNNLKFIDYNGIDFPFEENSFDCAVTRYALHHFPDIEKAFAEIQRVVKPNGQLFISDPTPNKGDDIRFVDTYMQMKDDGHVKFYTKNELIELANRFEFELEACFITKIRFPSDRTEKYLEIVGDFDENIIDSYDVKVINGQVYITEEVLNLSFRKKS